MKQGQNRIFSAGFIGLLIVIAVSPAVAKRKDDIVVLKNGDRMTGEIKFLKRGELNFKASYMTEAVSLDWAEVARLESHDKYLISLIDGQIFTDSFQLTAAAHHSKSFAIGDGGAIKINQMEVLRLLPVETNFWSHLEGYVDFGVNFTSGNDQYQTDFAASATYRKRDHSFTGAVASDFSGQTHGSSSARNEFTFDYRKQLSPKWFAGGLLDFLRSDQQSLALRTTAGGIIGRNLIQSERTRLSTFGGIAGTRERYTVAPPIATKTNADAIGGLEFTTFRFSATDLTSRFLVYPSLTIPGRVRAQLTTNFDIKIAKDFWWRFHVYENFDSKPPVRADKNDLGLSAGISWKF
jgi:hypothetical protein